MIEQQEVLQTLVEACPELNDEVQAHLAENGNELLYVAAGAIARRLLALHEQGAITSLQAAATAIERLHVSGSPWVKEFATIGLLEGIQNVWANSGADPENFAKYLLAESRRWWQGLNRFWSGQASAVRGEA
jgi:hypothetical protein